MKSKAKKRSNASELWRRWRKNKASVAALIYLMILLFGIVFVSVLSPYDYAKVDLTQTFVSPCLAHPFGTDNFGRDILTRLLYGGRTSILVALMSVGISLTSGTIIGALCGYFGKKFDIIVMRVMDVFMCIPGVLMGVCVSVALGTGTVNTAFAIAVGIIPASARQIRSSTLLIRSQEYIEAAQCFGASHFRIITRHLLPNSLAPLIVQASLQIGGAITAIAGLSFLGLGVTTPTPEGGNIHSDGRSYMLRFWPLLVFPTLMIALTMLAFNLLGDGLRDAMDPRMKR